MRRSTHIAKAHKHNERNLICTVKIVKVGYLFDAQWIINLYFSQNKNWPNIVYFLRFTIVLMCGLEFSLIVSRCHFWSNVRLSLTSFHLINLPPLVLLVKDRDRCFYGTFDLALLLHTIINSLLLWSECLNSFIITYI